MKATLLGGIVAVLLLLGGCGDQDKPAKTTSTDESHKQTWKELFDGKTLTGWAVPRAGNEGAVEVKDGAIHLGLGEMGTFLRYEGKVPTTNYEISYEAQRLDGSDFFAALTFPVGKGFCTLVNGGWANTITGLSSIDGLDASMNTTTTEVLYENKKWYAFRVRVTDQFVRCWVDGERIINQPRKKDEFSVPLDADSEEDFYYQFDTRIEVEDCKPLGFASWWSHGAIRKIHLHELSEVELRLDAAETE